MKLRRVKITPETIKEIERLDRATFKSSPKVDLSEGTWWIVRTPAGRAIAFAGMRPSVMKCHEGMGYMIRCGVISDFRGMGIQRKLIKARVSHAKRQGMSAVITYVMNWNLKSANNAISCGFKLYKPSHPYMGNDVFYFKKELA